MKLTEGGKFEQPEAGSYAATCIQVIDVGTQTSEYEGQQKTRRQIIVGWELEEKMKNGKPFVVNQFYTASLGERAKLRAHLEAIRGKALTAEELKGFESKDLINLSALVSLVVNAKGKTKINGMSKLPKGMSAVNPVTPRTYFSLDEFDQAVFDGISEGFKKIIIQSPEYAALFSTTAQEASTVNSAPTEEVNF